MNMVKKLMSIGVSKEQSEMAVKEAQPESRCQVFGVYDKKAKHFLAPIFLVNKEVAIRTFTSGVNHPESRFRQNPDDYCLYHLGSFDDETGEFTNLPEKIFLIHASDVIQTPINQGVTDVK